MISFRQVTKVFRDAQGNDVVAVDRFNLEVQAGETVCLIGTSGSGKTTALRVVNRLIDPTEGHVTVGGCDVLEVDPITLRRSIGYVIQRGGLFPHMTVARNVGLLCRLEGWARARIEERVAELLEIVNLPPAEFAHRSPGELSGGQRQRVGVARALALDPGIILMDEPFGAVDPITRGQLHAEFKQLESTVRKTVLLVTHDMAEAFALGDRIALMDQGRLIQVGTEVDFRERPADEFVQEFVSGHFDGGGGHA